MKIKCMSKNLFVRGDYMLIALMNIYKYEVYFRQVFSFIRGKKFKHGEPILVIPELLMILAGSIPMGEPFRLVGMLFVPLVVAGDTRGLGGAG